LAFVYDCINWRNEKPYTYQDEILAEVGTRKKVCIRGPHGPGKTALSAWLVLWFALTRDGDDWKVPDSGHRGAKRSGTRILTVGTDCSVGKMYTTITLGKALNQQGKKAHFVATGQTGSYYTFTVCLKVNFMDCRNNLNLRGDNCAG